MIRECDLSACLLALQSPLLGRRSTAFAKCTSDDCDDYKQARDRHSGRRPTIANGDDTHSSPSWPTVPSPHRFRSECGDSGRRIHWDKEQVETQDGARRARCALCWAGLPLPLALIPTAAAAPPPRTPGEASNHPRASTDTFVLPFFSLLLCSKHSSGIPKSPPSFPALSVSSWKSPMLEEKGTFYYCYYINIILPLLYYYY